MTIDLVSFILGFAAGGFAVAVAYVVAMAREHKRV